MPVLEEGIRRININEELCGLCKYVDIIEVNVCITGHEGSEGEQMYSSTLPSTSALDAGWVVSTTPRLLYPRERPGTHCIGGWVGPPGVGLEGCENLALHRNSNPGPCNP